MKTTNNGSFPWSGTPLGEELLKLLRAVPPGGPLPDAARSIRDRLTRQAIDRQVEAGVDLVTDGLVRRDDPVTHLIGGLEGVEIGPPHDGYPAGDGRYRVPIVRHELGWTAPVLVEDYLFAAHGAGAPVKVVLTGPFSIATLTEDHAYGEPMALSMALATAFNQELRALQGAGVTFIQVDEPALPQRPEEFPVFTRIWEVLGRGIHATLALHLEGGSIAGLRVGLSRLKRLGCLSVDCVSAPDNLGTLAEAPLPEGIRLSLGLVSGRSAEVESPDALAAAVRAAPGLPQGDRLLLGTASDLGGLTPGIAAAKLEALAETRRRLAGERAS